VADISTQEQQKMIDRYGELDRQYKAMKPILDQREECQKKIQSWYADKPADEQYSAVGKQYTLNIGPREKKHIIVGMTKLYKSIGQKLFLSLCTFPITRLMGLGIDLDGIVVEERSGSRKITAVLREPAGKVA
jgi:hypothetical protein